MPMLSCRQLFDCRVAAVTQVQAERSIEYKDRLVLDLWY